MLARIAIPVCTEGTSTLLYFSSAPYWVVVAWPTDVYLIYNVYFKIYI